MKPNLAGRLVRTIVLLTVPITLWGAARDNGADRSPAGSESAAQVAPVDSVELANKPVETMPPLSPVTQDILKMTKAGVSKEVIKTYIENAAITISPGAADLVALKEQGVPDEIATTLVKRSGEARARTASPGAATAAPTQGTRRVIVRQQLDPDPESYEYFQQNYLYPRTLASAYHRLGRYSVPGYYGYYRGYGSYGPYRGYGGRRYLAPMYR